jgi:trehalose synthase
VSLVRWIEVPQRSAGRLETVIGSQRQSRLVRAAEQFRERLGDRTIWTVSSTSVGGGVAEMLHVLLGYAHDLQVPIRWGVITGDAEFFTVTKRLHNQIHGDGTGGPLRAEEASHYATVLAGNAVELLDQVRPGDLVLLHDPQTAGLAPALASAGARVAWRCHIGLDWENEATDDAWSFLRPYLKAAGMRVFSRREYVPGWIPDQSVAIIPPSIDPFAPKNQPLDDDTVLAILARIGVLDTVSANTGSAAAGSASTVPPGAGPAFTRGDGSPGTVSGAAEVTCEELPGPDDPVVVQVSRWDRLKDMPGVMHGFASYAASGGAGYLLLVGPAVAGVSDDPEGAAVFADCLLQWRALPAAVRRRILLVTLPLEDADENAVMVNALQRHAAVIVQKSLAEGFGLTVAEGMWKARPVIGSAVGGIIDQIADGTGILLPDPRDLGAFAAAIRQLLADPGEAAAMGKAAQVHVGEHYVGDLHLLRYADLFDALMQ